jgi:hopene-associated glycosyltransferase HpnB
VWIVVGAAAACLWLAVLIAPWQPCRTRERLDSPADGGDADPDALAGIDAIIPARNEAALIEDTVRALAAQSTAVHILVVDDQSTDGTGARARQAGATEVLTSAPLPEGWTGKLWALEQGFRRTHSPYVLLLDADIVLAPGVLRALRMQLRRSGAQLVSVMAEPRLRSFWERLLLPAFVYFFKLLYPFRLANGRTSLVAAAAGGCVLLERRVLEQIGGFAALRGELIDDCTLARLVKRAGFRTWIGLTRAARSQRPSERLGAIWDMVARTAFTQLRYSPVWLGACTVLMLLAFAVPVACLAAPDDAARAAGAAALFALSASYLPVLRYYGLSALRAPTLLLAAILFLAMTWTSALRYWRGTRSTWKGRVYASTRSPASIAPVD